MRYIIAMMLLVVSVVAYAAPLTPTQKVLAENLIQQDMAGYVAGENALLGNAYANAVTQWTSSAQIAAQYQSNAVAADALYKDKIVFVSGAFISAENWIGDVYRIEMGNVIAEMPKENAAFLAGAHWGEKIGLACVMSGNEIDGVHLDDCRSARSAESMIAQQFVENYLPRMANMTQGMEIEVVVRVLDEILPADSACRNADSIGSTICTAQFDAVMKDPATKARVLALSKTPEFSSRIAAIKRSPVATVADTQ